MHRTQRLRHSLLLLTVVGAACSALLCGAAAAAAQTPPPVFSRSFGNSGQLRLPRGVAIAPNHDVWVSDSRKDCIEEFSEGGAFIREFGTPGSQPGELSSPQGIAVDAKGDVWVADSGNFRVEEFSETGAPLQSFGSPGASEGQFEDPVAVALGSQGHVFVVDSAPLQNVDRVEEFSEQGAFVRAFSSAGSEEAELEFNGPKGIAIAEGNVWIADEFSSRIEEFSEATGRPLRRFGVAGAAPGALDLPAGVALDSEHHVWVADAGSDRIDEFTQDGGLLASFGSTGSGEGQFLAPSALAVTPGGSVWVADTGNGRAQELTSQGAVVTQAGSSAAPGELRSPSGVAVDDRGDIWVSDSANNRIQEFAESGRLIRQFGASGPEPLASPRGIAFAGGDIWVADSRNNRIVEFDEAGDVEGQFGEFGLGQGQLDHPVAVAVDSQGHVWVANDAGFEGNADIEEFEPRGTDGARLILELGGAAQGELATPAALAFARNGDLLVAERFGGRVEEYRPEGAGATLVRDVRRADRRTRPARDADGNCRGRQRRRLGGGRAERSHRGVQRRRRRRGAEAGERIRLRGIGRRPVLGPERPGRHDDGQRVDRRPGERLGPGVDTPEQL